MLAVLGLGAGAAAGIAFGAAAGAAAGFAAGATVGTAGTALVAGACRCTSNGGQTRHNEPPRDNRGESAV